MGKTKWWPESRKSLKKRLELGKRTQEKLRDENADLRHELRAAKTALAAYQLAEEKRAKEKHVCGEHCRNCEHAAKRLERVTDTRYVEELGCMLDIDCEDFARKPKTQPRQRPPYKGMSMEDWGA